MVEPARSFASTKDFFNVALKSFAHTGTLFPSTGYAAETICRAIPNGAATVVEYGPGSGVLTAALLKNSTSERRVVGIEIVDAFVADLSRLEDDRLTVIHDDVLDASATLREVFPDGVDAIVAGIPFSFLRPAERDRLIRQTHAALKEEGVFVLYQNSPLMMKTLKRYFAEVSLSIEFRNLPPYFIMVARKGNG